MSVTADTSLSSANVLTGVQKLYIAPTGTAVPTIAATTGSALTIDPAWILAGFTNAGYQFEYSPTMKAINVDEAMSPVAMLKTAESLKITGSLSEATLTNLNLAISGATFTDVAAGVGLAEIAKLTVGGSVAFSFYAACFIGTNPFGFPRITHCYKVYSTAKINLAFKRDSEIMIPIEFSGLADTSRAIGDQLFEIIEKRANGS